MSGTNGSDAYFSDSSAPPPPICCFKKKGCSILWGQMPPWEAVKHSSFGLLTWFDVQLDAWSWLCFRSQVTGIRKCTYSGEHISVSGPSNCEILKGVPDLDAVVTIKPNRMTWTEHVTRLAENRNTCRVLVGKPEWNRLLWRPRRTWG